MKKFFSTLLVVAFFFTGISFAGGPENFSDVSSGDRYYNAINWVKEQGIVKGYADGEYKPDNTITRAEFVKMLLISKYAQWAINAGDGGGFTDVAREDWFSEYVYFSQVEGIIEGYSDGSFRPKNTINFAESSKIISLLHLDYTSDKYSCDETWWCGYKKAFEEKNLPTFSGDHLLTRGEMAEILYKIYNKDDNSGKFLENNTARENELEILLQKLIMMDYNENSTIELDDYSLVTFIDTIEGKDFYIASIVCGGPCPNSLISLYDNDGTIEIVGELNDDSSIYSDLRNPQQISDFLSKNNVIFGSTLPEKYTPPKNLFLVGGGIANTETMIPFFDVHRFELNPYLLKTGMVIDGKEIFTNEKNGFILRLGDSVSHYYAIDIPFLEDKQLAQITWNNNIDSGKYDKEWRKGYTYQDQTGCGSGNYASVVSKEKAVDKWDYTGFNIFIDPEEDLVETGRGENGEEIYEFKDSNHVFLKNMYENKYYDYDEKISYEDFISVHPVFFWKDNLGRWIKFEANKFIPQAECGKPVIYLYPEEETAVHVKVSPKGGFSITIPEHGENGWDVIAKPNGDITESSTGKLFPYLFWEGTGGLYESPKKGWVIEKNQADFFVAGKLRQFGLNTQEISDFLEFWSPRLQKGNKEYVFISFWGTQYMNSIAPLKIEPKPDSLVRVLMDFHEEESFYETQAPTIPKFERNGFVVVEWGGTLWTK